MCFVCPNPYLLSGETDSAQMRMGSGDLALPTTLPLRLGSRRFRAALVNRGTVDAPVMMTINGTGETPTIINHTTGAAIAVGRQIATGEKLVIHTDPAALSCILIRTDGTQEDAFGYLDPSVAVSAFVLVPGTNEVEYVPSAASTGSCVEIEWKSCYEGV
ncbi:MAG: phage tail family protein [Clostridia bacterium]|nr:phage tail family protein [Clostridia bacterium]